MINHCEQILLFKVRLLTRFNGSESNGYLLFKYIESLYSFHFYKGDNGNLSILNKILDFIVSRHLLLRGSTV